MTFIEAFIDELEKTGARKRKRSPFMSAFRGALVGAGLGAAASSLGAPFTYMGLRKGPKKYGHKDALVATVLRLGERAAYGIPVGMIGGMGRS